MILEVEGLRLRRGGRLVLEIPRLAVHRGEVLAVVGPNGAGKSSLLHSLGLLVPAQFARYLFDGKTVRVPSDSLTLRRQMALVMQEALLLDTSVLENAAAGLRLRGVGRAEAHRRAREWLERLGVGHLAGRHARELSGGEAQRVSLARALAMTPKVLMLDEPFGSLDVLTRTALLKDLRQLLEEAGATTLLVTHDVTEVALLADRMVVLEQGQLVQEGVPEEVFAAPQSAMVRRMAEMAAETAAVLAPLAQRSTGRERLG